MDDDNGQQVDLLHRIEELRAKYGPVEPRGDYLARLESVREEINELLTFERLVDEAQ